MSVLQAVKDFIQVKKCGKGGKKKYEAVLTPINYSQEAETPEEAIHKLLHQISIACEGDYLPVVIQARGEYAMIFREPLSGWFMCCPRREIEGRVISPEKATILIGHYASGSYPTKADAERAARVDLAQNVWDGKEITSPYILDKEDQKQFTQWAKWQLDYKRLREEGKTDHEAHALARGNW